MNYNSNKRRLGQMCLAHVEMINIIERTVHGPGTHNAIMNNKFAMQRWLSIWGHDWLSHEEHALVREACSLRWFALPQKAQHVTYQFLCDLITGILYGKGIDVWDVIISTTEGEEA